MQEGVSPKEMDKKTKLMGFPVGTATLIDEVGIDVGAHVADYISGAFGPRFGFGSSETSLLKDMVAQGYLGMIHSVLMFQYKKLSIIGVTHSQEFGTRNLHMFLECGSCFPMQVFFWYKFIAPNRTQLYSVQDICMHGCVFAWRCLSHLLSAMVVMQVCCTMNLHQIFGTRNVSQILERMSPLLMLLCVNSVFKQHSVTPHLSADSTSLVFNNSRLVRNTCS